MAGFVLWSMALVVIMQVSYITAISDSCEKFAALQVFTPKGKGIHIVPLEQGLSEGMSVTIEGRVHGNTSEIEVSLFAPEHKRFDDQSSLALQIKFNLAKRIALLNSFLGDKWGQSQTAHGIHFQNERPFRITIETEGTRFKVLTDDKLLTTRPYQFPPEKVSHVRVSGDLSDIKITYFTLSASCRVNPKLRTKILQLRGAAPYVSLLEGSLIAGTALSVVGTMHAHASWLVINLQSDGKKEKLIALQFMPRIYENSTVRNTFKDGLWGAEERRMGTLPVHAGQDFTITFHCEEKDFKICVNGQTFTTYKHRIDPRTVTKAFINGDVTVHGVLQHTNEKALSPHTIYCSSRNQSSSLVCQNGSKLKEHSLYAPKPDESYNAALIYGFGKGSVLVLSGSVGSEQWGAIDLGSNSNISIPLHFNPRFKEEAVVRNTMIDGLWGDEERVGGVPFKAGTNFTVTIKCEQDDFKIDVDGKPFTTYKHRVDSKNIHSLHVRGIFHLNKVNYFTPEKC